MPTGSSRLEGGRSLRICTNTCCWSDSERGSVFRASPRMSRCVSFHEVSFDDVSLCSGLLANRRCILCASWIVCVNSLGYQQTRNTITRTISVVRVHIFLPLLPEWSHLPSHVSFMPTVPTVSLQFLHQITDTPCQLLLPLLHHLRSDLSNTSVG